MSAAGGLPRSPALPRRALRRQGRAVARVRVCAPGRRHRPHYPRVSIRGYADDGLWAGAATAAPGTMRRPAPSSSARLAHLDPVDACGRQARARHTRRSARADGGPPAHRGRVASARLAAAPARRASLGAMPRLRSAHARTSSPPQRAADPPSRGRGGARPWRSTRWWGR